jgi:hypothetical protein
MTGLSAAALEAGPAVLRPEAPRPVDDEVEALLAHVVADVLAKEARSFCYIQGSRHKRSSFLMVCLHTRTVICVLLRVAGPGTDVMIFKIFLTKNSANKLAFWLKIKPNYTKF